jgi:hypothetical protein
MQKKKNIKSIEKKKEKRWETKHTLWFLLFIFIFCIPLSIKIFEFMQEKDSGVVEYTWGCFLRSIEDWTGRNQIERFEIIPSNSPHWDLPVFEINQDTYEKLGWIISEIPQKNICNSDIHIKYSPGSHSLNLLEIL